MSGADTNSESSTPALRQWLARGLSWKFWLPVGSLLLAVVGPLMYRESRLSAIPDIGDPFDVEEFCKLSVEPADNAWLDYEAAFALLVPKSHIPSQEVEAALEGNWADATPGVRQWLSDNQPALQRWRAGTAMDRSLRVRPAEAAFLSFAGEISAQRTLMQLAQLDSLQREADEDLTGAWDSLRSLFRYSRHAGMNETTIQRWIGVAAHQNAVTAASRWANLDQVTAEQLQTALRDVHADYQMTTPLSSTVKLEYLIALGISKTHIEVLREAKASTFKAFGHAKPVRPGRLALFLIHEPELSRRLLQHQVADLLQHIDEPACTYPRNLANVAYFDAPRPPGSGVLSPAEFEVEYARAPFADLLLLHGIPVYAAVQEKSLQLALEVALGAQCYRRESGELPETLSELVTAGILPEIPDDPWGMPGAKLQYVRDPADFSRGKVWSVGANRVDDGGELVFHVLGAGDEGLWIGEPPVTD